VSATLNEFRAGVIAERQFVASALAQRFTAENWHARCVHLAARPDLGPEIYGRLAVALFTLEGIENS
jgi:hypothetical protein